MIRGLRFKDAPHAAALCKLAFEHGLIMETSGPHDETAKVMPPLTIEPATLAEGLDRLTACAAALRTGAAGRAKAAAGGKR